MNLDPSLEFIHPYYKKICSELHLYMQLELPYII